MKLTKRTLAIAALCLVVLLSFPLVSMLLYPADTVVIKTAWHLRVVDEEGNPIPGAKVKRTWEHYPYLLKEQTDFTLTDSVGMANLPIRSIRKTTRAKVEDVLSNLATGVHSSWGLNATIDIDAEGYQGRTFEQIITEHVALFGSLENGKTAEIELGKTPEERIFGKWRSK